MTYLFGDATPFPLEENFIETISAAVDSCVALFSLDVEQSERFRSARAAAEQAEKDLERLTNLARAVDRALAPMLPKGDASGTAEITASQIAEHAATLIKQSRATIVRRRDTSMRLSKDATLGQRILEAMQTFFLHQQVPKTVWLYDWSAGRQPGESDLVFTASSPGKLQTTYRAPVPGDSIWSGPVRLDEVDPGYHLEFSHKGGWLKRGTHSGKIAVERMYLTEVVRSPEISWFMLRQNANKPSIGYKVIVRSRDHGAPVIFPVDARDEVGEPLGLDEAEELSLLELWKTMKRQLRKLARFRNTMMSARFRDQDISELGEPAELAECLLMSLAPLIREIRMRSRVPGELVLKRDLGDGRREELFVPRKQLERKFASLPYEQRSCFSAVGLDSEATSEFLRRSDVKLMAAERSGDARVVADLRRARRLATSSGHNES